MAIDEDRLRLIIGEAVKEAVTDATKPIEVKVTALHDKVIGDGENGLSARTKRNEDKIAGIENTFGKIYTIASIPLGGLIMLAVNYIFGQNHPPATK